MNKQEFNNYVFDQLRDLTEDEVFNNHRVKNPLNSLTWSYNNRFDSADLFDKTGLTTGDNHFLTTCNN